MNQRLKKNSISVGAIVALAAAVLAGGNIYSQQNTNVTPISEPAYVQEQLLTFKNEELKNQHFEKHGREMGFASADEYEVAAAAVVNNPQSLHKIEAEDGDDVYYLEATNEFVIVSTRGYIRTYYYPRDGIDYFNRQ